MSESNKVDITELLSQLRDIQEPVAPQGTSLWLIASCVTLTLLLGFILWFQQNRSRYAFRREALIRINAIANRKNGADEGSVFDLAALLRQLMRQRVGERINALDDIAWLKALDTEFNSAWFTSGRGRMFGSALYSRTEISTQELKTVCKELKSEIRRLKPISPAT